ncbi:clock-controlled-9 protein [Tuber indicum]|nr:clock-controlled-9 protein [Tuber indicum]
MSHPLVRFCTKLGVKLNWYIPTPNEKVFRITKTNHNILQRGVDPEARFDREQQALLNGWTAENAKLYWLSHGGPLAPGAADVVIIDDPQMPARIPLIKKVRPEVKIIYRSPIEIRSDLVERPGRPQGQVWQWIRECVQEPVICISYPMDKFVPNDVPLAMVGLMPVCTDWLDGLNKPLGEGNLRLYHDNLRNSCNELKMNKLLYPEREYITRIARFDTCKGIPDVIESYQQLCAYITRDSPEMLPPQLLRCGHGAIDDLDALILVVQLSLGERFEVKVSEALHHGTPVVATRAGGIPLQIEHGNSWFLVEVDVTQSVANHLSNLYTNDYLYTRMSTYAKASVSDEAGTVLKPNGKWITDIARAEAGQNYEDGEPRLPSKGN